MKEISQPSATVALVLGAAGFIGRHVCREMSRRGFTVQGIGHGHWVKAEQLAWGVDYWSESDVTREALNTVIDGVSPAVVIHCAGGSSVPVSYSAPLDDYVRSALSTAMALEFVRCYPGKRPRLVLASSAAVYGDQGEINLVESDLQAPASPYGFHKVAAENLCRSYSRFFDVQTTVVRLFSVYGEGLRKQLLWDAMQKLRRGDSMFFGTGEELRDWIHVSDAAALLCAAAEDVQACGEIYNGGNEHATTRRVLVELSQLVGSSLVPSFNGQTHVGNPRRLTSNSNHAQRQLGWTPQVSLSEGLARYTRWFDSVQP